MNIGATVQYLLATTMNQQVLYPKGYNPGVYSLVDWLVARYKRNVLNNVKVYIHMFSKLLTEVKFVITFQMSKT